MAKVNWLSVLGDFKNIKGGIRFLGGETELEGGRTGPAVGNFIADRRLGAGAISAEIVFNEATENHSVGLILYYHSTTGGFVTATLGGPALCAIRSFGGSEWVDHVGRGGADQLERGVKYALRAVVSGSRVVVSLNGAEIVSTMLPFSLPLGQCGVWCVGSRPITITKFSVEPRAPRAFVVMQFTESFNALYKDVIQPVCSSVGLEAFRADDQYGPGIIIADIERQIVNASLVIADVTPANPNVFWEVGYAHALKKPTILLAQRGTELPFDLSPFRTLFYEDTIGGKAHVEEELHQHLVAIQESWTAT